jgi:hypothetical protein
MKKKSDGETVQEGIGLFRIESIISVWIVRVSRMACPFRLLGVLVPRTLDWDWLLGFSNPKFPLLGYLEA